jgi:hypothetical protein
MADVNPIITIIYLNMNELNNIIKQQKLSHWIIKTKPGKYCLKETYFKF